jgi:hypothetical protein
MAKNKNDIMKQVEIINPNKKYFDYILIICFGVFICYFSTFKITGDDDVFWHLATGRYVVQTHNVPSTDIFGYMTQGQQWMPFEWGWDVITYGVWSFSGYTGLSILRTIILLAIFYIYLLILRKFKVSYFLSFLFLLLIAFAIIDRLSPRPHLMTYLFFALLMLIIVQYRYVKRNSYKILYFIPLIFFLWANMHMGIIAGMSLFGLYVFAETLMYLFPRRFSSKEIPSLSKLDMIRLLLILLASVLVMLVNPNFYQTYIYAYEHTKMKMLETVNEWVSPFSDKYTGSFVSTIYEILLFLGVITIYYSIKKKDIFPVIVYLFFSVYSVRAMRFTVDFVLIDFTFIVVSLNYIINLFKSRSIRNVIENSPVPVAVLSILLIYLCVSISNDDLYIKHLKYYRVKGFGINSDFIPTQMFDFMKENKITEKGERIFNHFGTGGFFIWNFPDRKNFIDSRNLNDDIFYKYNQILSKRTGFEQKLNEYDIDYAIYLAPDLVRMPQEMEQTIISYFCKSNSWKLVFWDDKSFLWVKNIPKFQELIDRYEYKYLNPYNVIYRKNIIEKATKEDKETAKKELNRKLSEDPGGIVINTAVKMIGNSSN